MHVPPIRTARFELVSMSMRFMTLLLARDLDGASEELGVRVPDELPAQLDNFLQFRIVDLELDPAAQPWLGRAIVLTEPDGTRRFVGTAGFHTPPDADGRVEVGYRVEPRYRRQGVATEVVGVARGHLAPRLPSDQRPDGRYRRRGAGLRAR
ncbi:MAG: GNAT family N-acetyltransferase [Chloroflexi bacterium]|nr:GNAT family N-acetyltransferase [Chloroflexota bacterium]